MKLKEFSYDLPDKLIAQDALEKRDESRLLVLHKNSGKIEHKIFKQIVSYFKKGDCLVLNNTKVIPARLIGEREDTGGKIEFVLLKCLGEDKWEVLVKPGRRAKAGKRFTFGKGELEAEILSSTESGGRVVRFYYDGIFKEKLEKLGQMPLPPYIKKKLTDKDRYQTVYAKHEGSAAAPTAGLHFTEQLIQEIKNKGVEIVYITLHVGLATFRPVRVENIEDHKMHSEFYFIGKKEADIINRVRKNGGRVWAVGTTTVRTLETVASDDGHLIPSSGWTDVFIYPGYKFKVTDVLITNFHLPESTLLMLVCAFADREKVLNAYKIAVENEYRFFSFGDAMLII
ncbi:MAG: S-adenosylmethionine:tRNA ribosyltransferase-isomerase [Thermosediminibacterales bacterium]|nr:S-adenosylmethionine:tRNA ribosyltransferase-isomerase [Thermosediminibacterales bacterium]